MNINKVIDLQKEREERTPHCTGKAVCLSCKHEWVAVSEVNNNWLECPNCGLTRGRFKFPFDWGEMVRYTCNCGNELFIITPDGTYCPNCGTWHFL